MAGATTYESYLMQGIVHLYRSKGSWYRVQFTFLDPVDPELMQRALDRVLARGNYFRMWFEKGLPDVVLRERTEPVRLRQSSEAMQHPAEPQGDLFYVSYEGATVFFDWHHFITDGNGASRFLTQLSAVYCELRYGAQISETPLVATEPYSLEALLQQTKEVHPDIPQLSRSSEMSESEDRYLIRICKADLVRKALTQGVKPFSLLMAVLCRAVELCRRSETITYGFTVDGRKVLHMPEALCNVSFGFRREIMSSAADSCSELVKRMDADVRYLLQPDIQRWQLATFMDGFVRLHRMKAPPRIKRRVQEMAETASGGTLDLFVSYLGAPLIPEGEGFCQYIRDAQFRFSEQNAAALAVNVYSINGSLNLGFSDRMGCPETRENIRRAFEETGLTCLIEELSDWF